MCTTRDTDLSWSNFPGGSLFWRLAAWLHTNPGQLRTVMESLVVFDWVTKQVTQHIETKSNNAAASCLHYSANNHSLNPMCSESQTGIIKFLIRNRRGRPHNTETAVGIILPYKNDPSPCHQMRLLGSRYAKIAFAAGAPPQTPLEELTVLPIAGKGRAPGEGKG